MALQLKTKAAITDRIMALMADGRERTVNDIRLRLKMTEPEVRSALLELTRDNRLVSKVHAKLNITIWRLPR